MSLTYSQSNQSILSCCCWNWPIKTKLGSQQLPEAAQGLGHGQLEILTICL